MARCCGCIDWEFDADTHDIDTQAAAPASEAPSSTRTHLSVLVPVACSAGALLDGDLRFSHSRAACEGVLRTSESMQVPDVSSSMIVPMHVKPGWRDPRRARECQCRS